MQHDAYDAGVPNDRPGPPPESAAGRHRKGAGGHRHGHRRARRPALSFRAVVTAAGAVAAALTVTTGVYVATLGTPADAGTRPDAAGSPAPLPVEPAPSGTTTSAAPAGSPAADTAGRVTAAAATTAAPSAPPAARPSPARVTRVVAARPATGQETQRRARAAPAAAGTAAQYIDQVLALANTERRKAGCEPLRSDARLRTAAQRHADDMSDRDYYAHDTPEGRSPGDRITAAGYDWSTWGENIFRGPHTPAEAVDGWMNSEGHRRNILNCAFKEMGVGVNLTPNGPWWVQDFASP
ncbi:CAP domain-containing protein [Streptomyces sp. NPDC054835]|uniref:CAP domain-containing protein n=1 Tax=unclassified Streptomyces TaxID=2593676 RepID=UPI002E319969|nr:CAP domain-containing protein [Streptomyces sp. NBC_01268]